MADETAPAEDTAPADETAATAIVAGPATVDATVDQDSPAGVDDGAEIVSGHGNRERVVYERDDTGRVTGWHKEHVAGPGDPAEGGAA